MEIDKCWIYINIPDDICNILNDITMKYLIIPYNSEEYKFGINNIEGGIIKNHRLTVLDYIKEIPDLKKYENYIEKGINITLKNIIKFIYNIKKDYSVAYIPIEHNKKFFSLHKKMKEDVKNKHFRNCTEFISLAYLKGNYSNNEIYLNEDIIKFNVYNIVFGDITKEYKHISKK